MSAAGAEDTLVCVVSKTEPVKTGFFSRVSTLIGGESRTAQARLEAFLDAVPGEYCGFAADGSLAYSEGFCALLGLDGIAALHDIQNVLSPGDAAALEGLYNRLAENGEAFSLSVQTADKDRTLRLSGGRGRDRGDAHHVSVLWLEDITALHREQKAMAARQTATEQERDALQAALDHAPAPLWLRDEHGDLRWCNRAYAAAGDTTPATVIAEQREWTLKPLKGGGRATGKALAHKAAESGNPASVNGHVIIDGDRRLVTITETALPDGATIGMARDISREEELETVHNRHLSANKELLEQLGSAIAMFDHAQALEFFNSAFAQLWHLEEAYLNKGPKLGDIMEKLREARRLPEQADFRKFKQGWLSMFTTLIQPHDEMLYLPDGSALRMLVIPHPQGGLMMTFEDVTSRLELESSYNTLIAVQKETLDNLAEGVSVFGGDGRLKLWNPSFARLWGFNPEQLQGEPHINRLLDTMKGRFAESAWETARGAIMTQALDRNIHEGQMEYADTTRIAYSTVPLPDGGVLVTHVDVTDKMRVENALREKNAALEEAEKVKLDFLANVSYQLRTPLNAIMGFAEILENEYFGALNERQREYTQGMRDAGDKLLSLINNILDLSTIEAGYMAIQYDKVSIHAMLTDIYELTREWGLKEKLTVRLDCPKNIGAIEADERRLKQVVLNLMRNAIAFTPEKGTIVIKASRRKDHLAISVIDTGPGIPEDARARIFEPFERLSGTGQGRGGTGAGLGLTLVKNIVELHHGKVRLESAEGKGTVITITLPLSAPEKQDRQQGKQQDKTAKRA